MKGTILTEEIKEARTPYAVMNSAINKKFIPTLDEIKTVNSFMLCRTISNHPLGVEVANFINNAYDIPIEVQYWFVRSTLNKVNYISYPKKQANNDKDIEIIAEHFECNYMQAKQYYKMLPEDERNKILVKYKHIGRTKL